MARRRSRRRSGKAARRSRRQEAKFERAALAVGGGLLVLVLLVGVAAALLGIDLTALGSTGSGGNSTASKVSDARIGDDPTLGPDSARVTIIEYADFGCPSCRAWHSLGLAEQMVADYNGDVRFVFRDYPVITPNSPKAAEAAQCAHDQGAFWAYHDYLYEQATSLAVRDLKQYAASLGLDSDRFNTCLDSSMHRSTIERDWDEALGLRLRGTPSFAVNGRVLIGPPSLLQLREIIDAELAN